MRYTTAFVLALVAIVLLMRVGAAWPEKRGAMRSMAAVRTQNPPVIDGKLDDACWGEAHVVSGFIDYRTEKLAFEQTFVRVLYDDENIYFAFECIEPDPNSIVAAERKYDQSLREEDKVEVRLDTFLDRRCAYVFAVNTLGTRFDERIGLFDDDDTWGCDWSAACTVGEDRWFAEIAIPIGNLLFERKDGATWGANFRRTEKGRQESSYWCYRNSQARFPRQYGVLTDLDLAEVAVDRSPSFETYLSGSSDLKKSHNQLATGLDATVRLSPELTSAFTIYPDFGQVDADPDTIELRDTERFLRERRTFFREGSELFVTPINIYYSRRFTDIDAGAKVTGQGRGWALGLIDVEGEIMREDRPFNGNYHIGRLIYNVGENSHIGGIWANSSRSDGRNLTGGLDTRVFLNSTTSFTMQFLGLQDSVGIETDGVTDHSGYGMYSAFTGGTQPWWWTVHYRDISRGFRPDLGYVPRRNIRGPGSFVRYRQNLATGPFKWISGFSDIDFYQDDNQNTVLRDFYESGGVCLRNEIELWYARSDSFHEPFQNWADRFRIEYNEDVDIWDSISVGFARGVYEEEPYKEYSIEKPARITNRLLTTVNGNYRIKDSLGGGDEHIWLWRWVTQYTFPWNGRIKMTAEKTSEGRHNLTMLFSWPVKKNTDFYLLLNDYHTGTENVRAAFVKVVYRFK